MPIYYVINGPVCSSLMVPPPPPSSRRGSPIQGTPHPAPLTTASGSRQPQPSWPMRNERSTGRQMTLDEVLQRRRPDRQTSAPQQQFGPSRAESRTLQEGPRERPPPDPAREYRIRLADGIIQAIRGKQYHTPDGNIHYLSQRNRMLGYQTKYYAPGDPLLKEWENPTTSSQRPNFATQFHFEPRSTLEVARAWATPRADGATCSVGVLNFASATRRGGGFRSGAQAQEETLARASNLIYSLESPEAEAFYSLHAKERHGGRGGFYTHAMIYSGSVTLMRDDEGEFAEPVCADILTSAAVNAGDVRRKSEALGKKKQDVEREIEIEMRERMGRILRVFEEKKDSVLILGSFGTGVFQNSVPTVASIWAQLLAPGGRFNGAFDHVVFAILGDATFLEFKGTFKEMEAVISVSALDVHV